MYTIELLINTETPKWRRINSEWATKEEASIIANNLIELAKSNKHDIFVFSNGYIVNTDFKVIDTEYHIWGNDIIDIRLSSVAPKIEIKKDTWHYKLTKLITPKASMPKSICGYFWNLLGRSLFFTFLIAALCGAFGSLGGTALINILTYYGITLGTGLTIGAYILGAILFAVVCCLVFVIIVGGVWLFCDYIPKKIAQRKLKARLEHTNIKKDIELREKSLTEEIHESFKGKHCNFIEFK